MFLDRLFHAPEKHLDLLRMRGFNEVGLDSAISFLNEVQEFAG